MLCRQLSVLINSSVYDNKYDDNDDVPFNICATERRQFVHSGRVSNEKQVLLVKAALQQYVGAKERLL